MADASAGVWLAQARSDLRAARLVYQSADDSTFCQSIAKHQQAVEKSIKGLAAAARDAGLVTLTIKFSHGVDKLINALRRLHVPSHNAAIQRRIARLLSPAHEIEIRALMSLAPHRPADPSTPLPRNTEYPFQQEGTWRAPADAGSFAEREVRRYQSLANHIVRGCERIASALARRPRAS